MNNDTIGGYYPGGGEAAQQWQAKVDEIAAMKPAEQAQLLRQVSPITRRRLEQGLRDRKDS